MKEYFTIGDRVKVLTDNYKGRTVGLVGTVRSSYDDSIAVNLDCLNNERSKYGCYYFKPKQLEFLKGEMNIMEGNYRVAKVQFIEGHSLELKYNYACYDPSIVEGDICVVKSAHHGFGLARVVDITPKTDEDIIREIVCRADFSDYEERVAQRKRKAELMTEMKKRAAAAQEIMIYKTLAVNDPTMAALLQEYEQLNGGANV